MEFRQLEYFIAVCRHKSFTRASEVLFVSQPAITNAINNLENELGIKLFNRTKRNVDLTAEGQTFYRHVSVVLNDVDHILLQMHQLKEQKRQVLKTAVDSFLALPVFLPGCRAFQEKYPQIRLSSLYCGCSEIQAALEREGYQVGIGLGDSDSFRSGRLVAKPVLSGKLCAVCRRQPEDLERPGETIAPKMAAAPKQAGAVMTGASNQAGTPEMAGMPEKIILMSPGYSFTKKAADFFHNLGKPVTLSYSGNFSVTAELLKQGRCAALVPDFLLDFLGDYSTAPIEIPDWEINIYLLSGQELSEHAQLFYRELEDFITGRQFYDL